jgi:hypothetical protein
MNPGKIVIDGIAYNSVDEMPEDVRRSYEQAMRGSGSTPPAGIDPLQSLNNVFTDADQNGILDIMENLQAPGVSGGMKFVVDGKTYNSVDDLPPDARARYEQAMGTMDKNRNGMPDFLEGMMGVSTQTIQPAATTTSFTPDTRRHASRLPMPVAPINTPDTSNGWMLVLGAGALLFLCAASAAGIWYFFLR